MSNSSGRGTTGGRDAPTPREGADRCVRECTGNDTLDSDTGGAGGGGIFVAAALGCAEAGSTGGAIVFGGGSSTAFFCFATAPREGGGGGGGTVGREVEPAREQLVVARLELREPIVCCNSNAGEML